MVVSPDLILHVVKEYFPCTYVASCPPLCMSMAVVFRLHSLRDHCLALVRISSPYNAQGIGV